MQRRKEKMPPEHCRKVFINRKSRSIGALKYIPTAIYNVLLSMPFPWETTRYVNVVYHIQGILTLVNDRRWVPDYRKKWSSVLAEMAGKDIRVLQMPLDLDWKYEHFQNPKPFVIRETEDIFSRRLRLWRIREYDRDIVGCRDLAGEERAFFPFLYGSKSKIIRYVAVGDRIGMHGAGGTTRVDSSYKFLKSEEHMNTVQTASKTCMREKRRHPAEIPVALYPTFYFDASRNKRYKRKASTIKKLASSRYFLRTELDWLEAGFQVISQGRNALSTLLSQKKIAYLYLDNSFNLVSKKPLKTKEKKKSRVGVSFHLTRELLKLLKMVLDLHYMFRTMRINRYELACNLNYLFMNVGVLTGIYRYKYKSMKQIRMAGGLFTWRSRDNVDYTSCGVWGEPWRVWMGWFRGNTKLLERYCERLVRRVAEGRTKDTAKKVTKQRVESAYDKEWRERFLREAEYLETDSLNIDMSNEREGLSETLYLISENVVGTDYEDLPTTERTRHLSRGKRRILAHLGEAWKCWKAHIGYSTGSKGIDRLIDKFIVERAGHYIRNSIVVRERLFKGQRVDKIALKKCVGRLGRLDLKCYIDRQNNYLHRGPFIPVNVALCMYNALCKYIQSRGLGKIEFPRSGEVNEMILINTLNALKGEFKREGVNREDSDELETIDTALCNIKETLYKIKKKLLVERTFKEIGYTPTTEGLKRCACRYQSVQRSTIGGILPSKNEITGHRQSEGASKSIEAEHMCIHPLDGVYKVDILDRIVDAFLDQYLFYEAHNMDLFPSYLKPRDEELGAQVVRNFCKKLSKGHSGHVLLQLKFENVEENIDLNLLTRMLRLVLDPILVDYMVSRNNASIYYKDMNFSNCVGIVKGLAFAPFVSMFYNMCVDLMLSDGNLFDGGHMYIREGIRHMDRLYILVDVRALCENGHVGERFSVWKDSTCTELGPKLVTRLGNAITSYIWSSMHSSVCTVSLEGATAQVFSFSLCNFRVTFSQKMPCSNAWKLGSFFVKLEVSEEGIIAFRQRMNHVLRSSTGSTFYKTINKWNAAILALFVYYREAVENTEELIEMAIKFERRVQNTIKMAINSKMAVRFPAVVFYAPRKAGGLGMYRGIAARANRQHANGNTYLNAGNKDAFDSGKRLPSIGDYIRPWQREFEESEEAYSKLSNMSLDEIKLLFNKGIPRISTIFHRDRNAALFDKGFRIRAMFRRYRLPKDNLFFFMSIRHDGRLWDLSCYDDDIVRYFGGLEQIYEHTLHASLGLKSEKLVFEEEVVCSKQMTKAQKSGLSQIPNRRFVLWWSPTINRAKVYVGYRTQLDLTGVFMHGKLSTVKISYVHIFRNHLWQNIHRSLVDSLVRNMDYEVERCKVNNKKSLNMHAFASDFVIRGAMDVKLVSFWSQGKEEGPDTKLCDENTGKVQAKHVDELWVDVQLRWCNYDDRDVGKQAEHVFKGHRTHQGFVVLFDLCYSRFAIYGYMPRDLVKLRNLCDMLLKTDTLVGVLRERIRRALGLLVDSPTVTSSNVEVFDSEYIVQFTREHLFVFKPKTGFIEHFALEFGKQDFRGRVCELLVRYLEKCGGTSSTVVVPCDLQMHIDSYASEYPFLKVRASEVKMHFECLPAQRISTKCLYKGWNTSPYTSFCRLALILKGASVQKGIIEELDAVWEKLSDDEWIVVENKVKDVVLAEYTRERFITRDILSQHDLRNIIFGVDVYKSRRILFFKNTDKSTKVREGRLGMLLSDWKSSFAYYENNVDDVVRAVLEVEGTCSSMDVVEPIHRNILETLIRISDLQRPIFALAMDCGYYAMIPQYSTYDFIHTARITDDVRSRIRAIVLFNGSREIYQDLCKRFSITDAALISVDTKTALRTVESEGVFLIPDLWNYNFCKEEIPMTYELRMGVPQKFFDEECRIHHFRKFYDANRKGDTS